MTLLSLDGRDSLIEFFQSGRGKHLLKLSIQLHFCIVRRYLKVQTYMVINLCYNMLKNTLEDLMENIRGNCRVDVAQWPIGAERIFISSCFSQSSFRNSVWRRMLLRCWLWSGWTERSLAITFEWTLHSEQQQPDLIKLSITCSG